MALARGSAVVVATATWTTVATVAGDAVKQVIGAVVECDDIAVAFEARIQINATDHIVGVRSPAGASAAVYDAPTTIPNTQVCSLQVLHAAGVNKNFSGTLLGS